MTILTATPISQTSSPLPLQSFQKILYSAQPAENLCCACIPFLPPDVAPRESAPFSSLEKIISRRQKYFRSPASSLSSCLFFLPFDNNSVHTVATQFCNFCLSYLPEATLRVYNHIYNQCGGHASTLNPQAPGTIACGFPLRGTGTTAWHR